MIRRSLPAMLLAAALAAALTAVTGPAQARACRIDHTCVTTYYSDSSRTVVVGEKYESCDGRVSGWGTRTGYLEFEESPC